MKGKKILIVTYYWPPSGGVGVQRWMNYAIQLKKLGWEPIIYTPENPQFEIKDHALLVRVKDIRVVKTKMWEPFSLFHKVTGNKNRKNVQQGLVLEKSRKGWIDNLFVWIRGNLFIPDPRRFWIGPSVRFLKEFMKNEEIETVITTGPPHSMHLIGLGLKRSIGCKWIADFRDPWSEWDVLTKLRVSKWALRKHRKLEKQILHYSDKILTVSSKLSDSLSQLGGGNKVSLLYNGVSPASEPKMKTAGPLTIGYFGMLNEIRNPSELWKVMDHLAKDSNLNLRLGGIIAESIKEEIGSYPSLSAKTDFLGYLSHNEVVEEYAKCDVLLLLLNRTDNAKWILPIKFFEYLAAGRYILSLGPEGSDLERVALDLPNFRMLRFDDVDGMEQFFNSEAKLPIDFSSSQKLLSQFSHSNLAQQLEQEIAKLHE